MRNTVQAVVADLRQRSASGKLAVVHVRRGDKIQMKSDGRCKFCCHQMIAATSPENIAKVLRRNKVGAGSAVYIMTNEANWTHFAPLWEQYKYDVRTWMHYNATAELMRGCSGSEGACENFLLFVIEEAIMNSVPKEGRITTVGGWDQWLIEGHVADTLMNDFRGECN